jgi:hypothetical protein
MQRVLLSPVYVAPMLLTLTLNSHECNGVLRFMLLTTGRHGSGAAAAAALESAKA